MQREIKILTARDLKPEVAVIVGTRPGIVMLAPIIHELRNRGLQHFVIHTGQHYSPNMDGQFFADLQLPTPDFRLEGVAEKRTHGGQTAAMLEGIENILLERRPKLILVGGDANTNLAGALAARKLHIRVGHVEAGERSFDWRMPEEHNRVLIDHISDYLFITGENARRNLETESVKGRICMTGNPIVDASKQHYELAKLRSSAIRRFGLRPDGYALLTMHREENVDDEDRLRGGLQGVSLAAEHANIPVLFLAHPRTLKRLKEFRLEDWAKRLPHIRLEAAVGYLDFLALIGSARLVFTDSGGVQQEACIHHVPCVTLRDNTEWTETLDIGANRLSGCVPAVIAAATQQALSTGREWVVPFGDGGAARRIVDCVAADLAAGDGGSRTDPEERGALALR